MYQIDFSDEAWKQIIRMRKSMPQTYKKLNVIIEELKEHPYSGTGHPEQLHYMICVGYGLGGWIRRIEYDTP